MSDLNILEEFDLESTAQWRRQKAEQFPDDAYRNLEAAKALDQLAKKLDEIEDAKYREYQARFSQLTETALSLDDDISCPVFEKLNEHKSTMLRDVGFRGGYENASDLIEDYLDAFDDLLQDAINDAADEDDSGLADQVKDDPEVVAAKAALDAAQERYDTVYAKAYAEARKRL